MHMLAPRPAAMSSHRSPEEISLATASIQLALANQLDADTLTCWLTRQLGCQRVAAIAADESLADALTGLAPDLVIVDPRRATEGLAAAVRYHRRHVHGRLLVFDARPREAVLLELLATPGVSYLTRAAGPEVLSRGLHAILQQDQRVFDPAFAARLRRTSRGFQLADDAGGSISMLTPRELEVMGRLGSGESVAECARRLGLSTSTVDNHRSRLMKKLRLHKAGLLTRRAIRDGVIEP
ncbi:MAG: hypothetical protein CMJ58_20605 [Planctomycetaceae bacterium]|nr:hypothetical protein [Planctomycetaceae bacterium]